MLNYSVKEKVNPQAPADPRKYYGVAKSSGEASLRFLAKRISKETTLGTPDVMAVLEALLQDIPELLLEGQIVKLGDFGSFNLTISGSGAETEEEYHSGLINRTNLHFRPGKEFKDQLSAVVFKKVS